MLVVIVFVGALDSAGNLTLVKIRLLIIVDAVGQCLAL